MKSDSTAGNKPLAESEPKTDNAAPPSVPSPFTDFAGLVRYLPAYKPRTLRSLVAKKIIPAIVLPARRKLNFHLPSVDAALLRYQQGGPPNLQPPDLQ